jgi:hypothetical protein
MHNLHRLAAICLLAGLSAAPARAEPGATVVVELFTSQGCSSCPPADALLGELAQRAGVLALSQHVDYWDYLGWRDPFASANATLRQRAYARRFGLRYVYTPQMVIHGNQEVSGADRTRVLDVVGTFAPQASVPIQVEPEDPDQVRVSIGPGNSGLAADVWLVRFDPAHTTRVQRGENGGKNLANHNVVRHMDRIGGWSGGTAVFRIPAGDGASGGASAVLVQEPEAGLILGVAEFRAAAE